MPEVASELQSLPFGTLIGGPLDAAIEAQARAAMSSVSFIRSVGFDEDNKVIPVTFIARKGDSEITINVPLLTIVPVPFIRIDEMTIDFKANITSSRQTTDQTTASVTKGAKLTAGASYLFAKASLEASISSKKDSSSTRDSKYSVETTIDVHVHAVQDQLPAGLSKMLNILADTIEAPPPVAAGAISEASDETADDEKKKRQRRSPGAADQESG